MEWMNINELRNIVKITKLKYFSENFNNCELIELIEAINSFELIYPYVETKIIYYKKYALNNNNDLTKVMETMDKFLIAEANILFILSSIIFTDFYSKKELDEYLKKNKKYVISNLEDISFIVDYINGIENISFLGNLFSKKLDTEL